MATGSDSVRVGDTGCEVTLMLVLGLRVGDRLAVLSCRPSAMGGEELYLKERGTNMVDRGG